MNVQAEIDGLNRPISYDIFMRAEERFLSECGIGFSYQNTLSPDPINPEDFHLLMLEVSRVYAIHIDNRLGWPRTIAFGQHFGLLIPHNCEGRVEVGKEIARIANERQDRFVVEVIKMTNHDIPGSRDFSIRREYEFSTEEWQLRKQAVQEPCNPENWRRLAKYHRERELKGSAQKNDDVSDTLSSTLFFTYAMIIDGNPVEESINQFFDDPRALPVVADLLRPQLERVKC